MSKTTFATDNALTKKIWDEQVFREAEKDSFFPKFHGKSADSLVHEKTQLEKSQGDKITFGLVKKLTGAGVSGTQVLENNEERLNTYDDSVTLEIYRHAIRDDGAMTRKRAMFSIDEEAKRAIKVWMSEKIDQLHFDALFASNTLTAYPLSSGAVMTLDTTAADAKLALTASDSKLTPAFISQLKTGAKTGFGRRIEPLRPVKVKGKEYLLLLVHPDVAYDLKRNSEVMNAWQYAVERGYDNPLFKDADVMWDGVCVHTHENCTIAADAGAGGNVAWAKGALMGAQALIWAYGKRAWTVMEEFDYGNEHGYAVNLIAGCTKPTFNSQDYGSIGVYNARSNISGATFA